MNRRTMLLAVPFCLPARGEDDEDRKEERRRRRRRERRRELEEKLARRLKMPAPAPEHAFLHERAAALIKRLEAESDDYRFDRLARAADSLLESSERIFDARRPPEEEKDGDDRRETALGLQSDYFRVQQADYFVIQSKERGADEYARHARSLYQQARRAYDSGDFHTAENLGDAASYLVRALESLAQAAVRIPEPPRL